MGLGSTKREEKASAREKSSDSSPEALKMITVSIVFALSLVVALVLTPWVRRLALAIGAVDPHGVTLRKVHDRTMPRLGGLAIVAAFLLPLLALLVADSSVGRIFRSDMLKVIGLISGGLVITVLGVYDDLRGANAPQKFLVQFGVAIALVALGFQVSIISTPFDVTLELGIFGPVISVLWIVGLINAMNLIDGLDGLAGGVTFFASLTMLVIAWVNHNVLMMLFMGALSGATLGFLAFNFNPARIFMGDTGSMFLGYVIAVTSLQTNTKGPATVALLAPILALGLPLVDTLLAMGRRFSRGQSMFQADREHIHHRLVALGLSHRNAVLILYGLCLLLGFASLAIAFGNRLQSAVVLVAAVIAVVVIVRRLGYSVFPRHRPHLRRKSSDVRKQQQVRSAAREL
ncbi:MAG: hypothetical protein A2341_10050, partial [Deltaproteobacteria bacterium RIFOXYB12_FULL_58_9]